MDFSFREHHLAITEAARELLVDICTSATLRSLLDSGAARDETRWSMLREMGLFGFMAPESHGGMGLELIDFIGIAEAAGYVGLPEPLLEQAGVVVPLLAGLPDDRGWLDRIIGGAVLAIGHPANRLVADADSADGLILDDDGDLHIVERSAVIMTRVESFDPFRRLFRVEWTPKTASRIEGSWGQTADRGALLAAAQMIGLGQRSIDLAVAYAKDRTQFGKPIGSYQAVKHLVATAQVAIEFARPVVHAAAAELPLDSLASRARVAHAKIAAGEAADGATHASVQVHGAMGMTWEIDLHFFLKRVFALRSAWGTEWAHRNLVIKRIAELPTGPDLTFSNEVAG